MYLEIDDLDKALIIGPFKELQVTSKTLFRNLLMYSQDVPSTQLPLHHGTKVILSSVVQEILNLLGHADQ